MSEFRQGPLMVKSKAFAIRIIRFCETLVEEKKFILSNQLLKSGTSIGANICEAQHAESQADFLHKIKVSCKEAIETLYWLELCQECYFNSLVITLIDDCNELLRMLNKAIYTSTKNLKESNKKSTGNKNH